MLYSLMLPREGKSVTPRVFVLIFSFVFCSPLWGADIYRVSHISVDISADTATQAREEALKEGRARAFEVLLRRLTRPQDWPLLPSLEDEVIRTFVRRFEIFDEKRSQTRYLARMTVHFDPRSIPLLLSQMKIPFSDTQHLPVLLLPLYEKEGEIFWDSTHPWGQALLQTDLESAPVPFILLGDAQDQLSLEDVTALDSGQMESLAKKYRVQEVLTAHVIDTPHWIRLLVRRPTPPQKDATTAASAPTTRTEVVLDLVFSEVLLEDLAQEDEVARLRGVAERLVQVFGQLWRHENIVALGAEGQQRLIVEFNAFEEWLEIRERLGRLSLIERYEVRSFGPDGAVMDVYFRGTLEDLSLSAALLGLQIEYEEQRDFWTMHLPNQETR